MDFNISSFTEAALETFNFQYQHNSLYRKYSDQVLTDKRQIKSIFNIPFLPVRFFKSHRVVTTEFQEQRIFESSGTTQTGNSRHFIKDTGLYQKSFTLGFEKFYGKPSDYCILALLPSYLERGNSSLVMMADELIKLSGHPDSGFYLDQFENMHRKILDLEQKAQPVILLGVTFALLDFAEQYPMKLKHTIVMETGGMKGRKKELTRQAVHDFLKQAWGIDSVHAEYGMTELLSQAYSKGGGIFYSPPWMKIILRAEDDPLSMTDEDQKPIKKGIINIIDLANRWSCAFIATDDMGILHDDGGFEIIGRVDNSDIRGCSLMVI